MENGWVKIHRKILKWEWYDDANTFRLFFHLLVSANHKDGRWQGTEIKRGQLIVGRKKLAKELKLSEKSIRTSLNKLKRTSEVAIKTTNKFSLVTLLNYDKYQEKGQPVGTPGASKGPAKGHKQECKEGKNVKNIYTPKNFKDGDKLQLGDGTTSVMRWGVWCDSSPPHNPLDRNYFKELP